jgi:protein-S-isoprenylcysteine O-methyltransferase Ste14
MASREQLARQGTWLYRHRGFLPLILLPLAFLAMSNVPLVGQSYTDDLFWELFCLLIALMGVAIRAIAIGYAPAGTSGNTRVPRASRLSTSGMYSIVRHPLYLGNYFAWLGIALFPQSLWLVLVITMVFAAYYGRIAVAEEEFLRSVFGAEFVQWAANTPAFIPDLRRWRRPAGPFSWPAVLRREYSGLSAIVVCFFALDMAGETLFYHRIVVDFVWLALLAFVVVLAIGLRSWKHHVDARVRRASVESLV